MPRMDQVFRFIETERQYQLIKHGEHKHALGDWILILEQELKEAKDAWLREGELRVCEEILQLAAVAVACLEQTHLVHEAKHMETIIKARFDLFDDGKPTTYAQLKAAIDARRSGPIIPTSSIGECVDGRMP